MEQDLMEQRVHELDARLRQMKEERDQVIAENEELQEQLDMSNTSASVGMQKINEIKIGTYVHNMQLFIAIYVPAFWV